MNKTDLAKGGLSEDCNDRPDIDPPLVRVARLLVNGQITPKDLQVLVAAAVQEATGQNVLISLAHQLAKGTEEGRSEDLDQLIKNARYVDLNLYLYEPGSPFGQLRKELGRRIRGSRYFNDALERMPQEKIKRIQYLPEAIIPSNSLRVSTSSNVPVTNNFGQYFFPGSWTELEILRYLITLDPDEVVLNAYRYMRSKGILAKRGNYVFIGDITRAGFDPGVRVKKLDSVFDKLCVFESVCAGFEVSIDIGSYYEVAVLPKVVGVEGSPLVVKDMTVDLRDSEEKIVKFVKRTLDQIRGGKLPEVSPLSPEIDVPVVRGSVLSLVRNFLRMIGVR